MAIRMIKLSKETLSMTPWHKRKKLTPTLTLNRFHTLLCCFYFWLWTSKCRPGSMMFWVFLRFCFQTITIFVKSCHGCLIRSKISFCQWLYFDHLSQLTFTFSKKHYKRVWNIFKVNNKNTRMTSMTSFWCFYW